MATPSVTLATLTLLLGIDLGSTLCPEQCRCHKHWSDCSQSNLEAVPIFLNPRTHVLKLQGNQIQHIQDAFSFYPNLRDLDLSNNSIVSLGRRQFLLQQELELLHLQNNKIGELMDAAFEGLVKLNDLNLHENKIVSLNGDVFKGCGRLKRLNLANNLIRLITRNAFQSLISLEDLDLRKNMLTYVPSDAFRYLTSIKHLHMGHNQLREVPFHAFFVMPSLQNMSLANNSIARIHPEAFTGIDSLRILDISHNKLDNFPATSLALPNLEELDASANIFPSLELQHMNALRRLRILRVCHSDIFQSVADFTFSNNVFLEEIHICENPQLEWISPQALDTLSHIRVLNLSGNGLGTLENITYMLRDVHVLDISGNPLVCNCSALWLWELPDHVRNTSEILPVRCVNNGKFLFHLSKSDFGCEMWIVHLIAGVATFVVVFCVIFATLLLIWRRRQSRHPKYMTNYYVNECSPKWDEGLSDGGDFKERQLFTQLQGDPGYGSVRPVEHFTFHSPDCMKKIPVTVV